MEMKEPMSVEEAIEILDATPEWRGVDIGLGNMGCGFRGNGEYFISPYREHGRFPLTGMNMELVRRGELHAPTRFWV